MGYLDNSTITVDAILTKKGREILEKYVLYTEQDKRVLESVKYEVRK